MEEQNVTRIRLRLIDLIKSFFISRPDAELLSRWRGTFSALAKEQISPVMDRSVRRLNEQLATKKLEDIQDEFYALFVDPFSDHRLNLYASHYFDGRNYGETLISVRQIFTDNNIKKQSDVTDPEDSLPILVDLLGTLIELDNVQSGSDLQTLVQTLLIPFVEKLKRQAEVNEIAGFYRAAIDFVSAYLDLERGLTGADR
jgi:TorA maturation chaperone TorD